MSFVITNAILENLKSKGVSLASPTPDSPVTTARTIPQITNMYMMLNDGYEWDGSDSPTPNKAAVWFSGNSSSTAATSYSEWTLNAGRYITRCPTVTWLKGLDVSTKLKAVADYVVTQADVTDMTQNNYTVSKGGSPLVVGTELFAGDVLTATANAGYDLGDVYFYYQDSNTGSLVYNRFSNGSLTFTAGDWIGLKGTTTAQPKKPDYTVTDKDVANMTENNYSVTKDGVVLASGTELFAGDVLTATANAGYDLGDVYFYYQDSNTGSLVYNRFSNGKLTFTSGDWIGLKGTTTVHIVPPDYTITDADIATLSNNHATATLNGVAIKSGDSVHWGDSIVVSADAGYKFTISADGHKYSAYFLAQSEQTGALLYLDPTVNDALTVATFDMEKPSDATTWSALKVTTEQQTVNAGTTNIFKVTDDNIATLNGERFVQKSTDTVYDYGQFIINVIRVPFTLNPSDILEPENITLADLKTSVTAPKLNNDLLTFDLGSITVTGDNQNAIDYNQVQTAIYLPLIGQIAIDSQYVIDQTVSIKYLLDVYTGQAEVVLSSSKTGSVFHTAKYDVAMVVPYSSFGNSANLNNGNINLGGENTIKSPYIEVFYSDLALKNGEYTIPVEDEGVLDSYTGYAEISNMELNVLAIKSEKDAILNLIRTGVIIK